MKFSVQIAAPLETTFNYYLDRENLMHWQKKVMSQDLIMGESGEVDSIYKLSCKGVDIFETLLLKDFPNQTISNFEHKRNGSTKMYHKTICHFSEIDTNHTKLEMTVDQSVIGIVPKFIMLLMAGSVKKHHQCLITDFKICVEKDLNSITNT